MGLKLYNDDKTIFGTLPVQKASEDSRFGPQRTHSDGRLGGAFETVVYVRNDDPSTYFTDIVMSYESELYNDVGEFGDSGWGIKYMYGERRPTEAEWDEVRSGEPLALPDIGSTVAADTYTYHPFWMRVYCPGGTAAQLRENQRLRISYYERKVGA
jgi:hypothetical protein